MKVLVPLSLCTVAALAGCRTSGSGAAVRAADVPLAADPAAVSPEQAVATDAAVDEMAGEVPLSPDCDGFAAATGDPLEWMLLHKDQKSLAKVFDCAPPSTQLPTGLGIGHGTLYQKWALWNDLQASIGSYIWGGKRLYLQSDGETCLLNQLNDNKTERYAAHVYIQPSSRDGKDVVVLDYRGDDTKASFLKPPVQLLIDRIARGIRDEIREVMVAGDDGKVVGSKVFVGRANLSRKAFVGGSLKNISDADFADPKKYVFAANFYLDFRPQTAVTALGNSTPSCYVGPPMKGNKKAGL